MENSIHPDQTTPKWSDLSFTLFAQVYLSEYLGLIGYFTIKKHYNIEGKMILQ